MRGVAFASFIADKDEPQKRVELNELWVFPEHRGKGASLRMILHILDYFIPLGVTRMEVYNLHYAPSNAFYKKFGGQVMAQEYQMDGKLLVDAVGFKERLEKTLLRYL